MLDDPRHLAITDVQRLDDPDSVFVLHGHGNKRKLRVIFKPSACASEHDDDTGPCPGSQKAGIGVPSRSAPLLTMIVATCAAPVPSSDLTGAGEPVVLKEAESGHGFVSGTCHRRAAGHRRPRAEGRARQESAAITGKSRAFAHSWPGLAAMAGPMRPNQRPPAPIRPAAGAIPKRYLLQAVIPAPPGRARPTNGSDRGFARSILIR